MSTRLAVLFVAALFVVSCSTPSPQPEPEHSEPAEHGEEGGAHEPGRFADPEQFVPEWNTPERDAWQMPDQIVAALEIGAGATVVDLGVGTGYLLPFLSEAVGPEGEVIAADIEPAMLRFLEAAVADEGWSNVRTHTAALDDPDLEAATADAFVTLNTWHHIEDRPAYAARVLDDLVAGGTFVIVDFLKEDTDGFGPPLEMRLHAEQVVAELTQGGFEVDIVEETMPRHYVVRGRKPAVD